MTKEQVAAPEGKSVQAKSKVTEKPTPERQPQTMTPGLAAILQRTMGNQAIGRLVGRNRKPIQAKMTLNAVNDPYEQEADSVAQQVVGQLNTPVQRQDDEDEIMTQRLQRQEDEDEIMTQRLQRQEDDEELMTKSASTHEGGEVATDVETRIQQAQGSGQPLADGVRQPMEQAFGADFSNVCIHTNSEADDLNQSVQARAFTTSQDIFFKEGEYSPGNSAGQELLAHELTHVVQQSSLNIQRQYYDNEQLLSSYQDDYVSSYSGYDESTAGMTSPDAPMSVMAPQYTNPEEELMSSWPSDYVSNYDENASETDAHMSTWMPDVNQSDNEFQNFSEEKLYTFSFRSERLENLSESSATDLLRKQIRQLYLNIGRYKGMHEELKKVRDEHYIVGFFADTLGRVSMPSLDIWEEPIALLETAKYNVEAQFLELAASSLQNAEQAYEVSKKEFLLYKDGTISGAETSITTLEAVKTSGEIAAGIAITASTGGLAAAGYSALYTMAQESATQVSEVGVGLEEKVDFVEVLLRGGEELIWSIAGDFIGGKLEPHIKKQFGSYLANIGDEVLLGLGENLGLGKALPRDYFLTKGQHVITEFLKGAGNNLLRTAVEEVVELCKGGESVSNPEELSQKTFTEMVNGGLEDAFTEYLIGTFANK